MATVAHPPDQALARAITDVLRQARRQGMTHKDLAEWFGVSEPTVSRWEAGGRQPALDLLPRFDELAGQSRGYVLRLAGYVGEDGAMFEINEDDPVEVALWNLTGIPEFERRQFVVQHRKDKVEPPPPSRRQPKPKRRRRAS